MWPRRGQSKLCLNSFRGKLKELNDRPKTKMIADRRELFRILTMPYIEVTSLLFADDNIIGHSDVRRKEEHARHASQEWDEWHMCYDWGIKIYSRLDSRK